MSPARLGRAVAIGGGTGMPIVLRSLLACGFDTAAVVTMADDGGSSGLLRREHGMPPPGDVRNCLVALADPGSVLARAFQYRFAQGAGLSGHALGNLILAALTDMTGSFPDAVDQAGALLGTRGSVLPSTLVDIRLVAVDVAGTPIDGQARIAASERPIARVRLLPERPAAHQPAIEAVRSADLIVIGPGSLFTSIVPNFLVDGMAEALKESRATRVYVCNVANQRGETKGMDAADHVEALVSHGLESAIDHVIVNAENGVRAGETPPWRASLEGTSFEWVMAGPAALARIEALGVGVVTWPVADRDDPRRHSTEALSRIIREVVV